MKDLTDLRKIAEAATPGPWVYGDNRDGLGNKLHPAKFPGKYNPIADFEYTEDEDAEHIATFDPPAVLALLARLEQAEAAVARVRGLALESQAEVAQMNMPNIRTLSGEILRALDGDTRG